MFSKRKAGQQRRRAKEQLYKSAEESGCLTFFLYLPFRVVFFYLFFPYRAFFKKDISPEWKVFHKIITAIIFALLALTGSTNGIKEGEENVTYLLIAIFAGLSLFSIISIFKKKS